MPRYISFRRPDGTPSFGRVEGETVHDLGQPGGPAWLLDALGGDLAALAPTASYTRAEVRLLPVVPNPGKILCIGLNYATHVAETGREQKEHPAVFTRWADTLLAAGDPVVRPKESTRFDYEGELAVIIGKGGRRISKANAMMHVAGYAVFNDVSVRDWQRHNIQFTPAVRSILRTAVAGTRHRSAAATIPAALHRENVPVHPAPPPARSHRTAAAIPGRHRYQSVPVPAAHCESDPALPVHDHTAGIRDACRI